MILFTRLNRSPVALNPDLIERVEANPDTVITLVDDKKVLVMESLEQVIELITDFRAYVILRSQNLEVVHDPQPTLHLVPNELVVSSLAEPIASEAGADTDDSSGGSLIGGLRSLLSERGNS